MGLLKELVLKPAPVTVTYKTLVDYLPKLGKKKRESIQGEVRKAGGQLEKVQMTVPANTNADSLSKLSTSGGVNIVLAGVAGGAPASKVARFREVLALFEEVPRDAVINPPVFEENNPSLKYPNISVAFLNKHQVPSQKVAKERAESRYRANPNIVVSTFVVEASLVMLDQEVGKLNKIGFFKLVNVWLKETEEERARLNKRVSEVLFRSRNHVRKWQCTQANGFEPFSTYDYMYYGTATREKKSYVDHYVPAAHIARLSEVPADTLEAYADKAGVDFNAIRTWMTDEDAENDGVKVYVEYDLAVD